MSKRIVVVGGGVGGTMLANQLAGKLYPEIQRGEVSITLLSDSPDHYYKPAFMYVAFNLFFREELKRPERSLLRPEIEFRVDKVTRFHFDRQELSTQSGQRHGYDYLVIATGCVPSPERIEGLKEPATTSTSTPPPASWRTACRASNAGGSSSASPSPRRPTFRTNAASPPSRPH